MTLWSLNFVRCPITREKLVLEDAVIERMPLNDKTKQIAGQLGLPLDELEQRVRTGVLVAPESRYYYPIYEYIPILLDFKNDFYYCDKLFKQAGKKYRKPPSSRVRPGEKAVQTSFTAQWNKLQNHRLTFTYTHEEREKFIELEIGTGGRQLPVGCAVLNVGCGFGMESLFLFNVVRRPVFGIDINFSLFNGVHHLLDNPLVTLALASAFAPPFADEAFGLVYSHGVLHHTFDTQLAFNRLLPLVRRDDGCIYIWVYALEDALSSGVGRAVGHHLEQVFRPLLAELPESLQNAVLYPLACWHLFHYRRYGLINREQWEFKNSLHSMRDRWMPKYAHRHSFHEVIGWFLRNGMDYRLLDPVAYQQSLGIQLIGVGVNGWWPRTVDDSAQIIVGQATFQNQFEKEQAHGAESPA